MENVFFAEKNAKNNVTKSSPSLLARELQLPSNNPTLENNVTSKTTIILTKSQACTQGRSILRAVCLATQDPSELVYVFEERLNVGYFANWFCSSVSP